MYEVVKVFTVPIVMMIGTLLLERLERKMGGTR
jgi:hypothetical protein